jgi:uncharacterized protein (DUF983 family)
MSQPLPSVPLRVVLARSLRLRCPTCGEGRVFRGWFRMAERCETCGLPFDRGPGFFLGSIYFNYGLTVLIVTVGYLSLWLGAGVSPDRLLWIAAAFAVLFPLWFFRWARSLWIGFDRYWDPVPRRPSEPRSS